MAWLGPGGRTTVPGDVWTVLGVKQSGFRVDDTDPEYP